MKPQLLALGPSRYVGVDLNAGENVDVVCAVENLPDDAEADLVVSCELLEHAQDWRGAFARMAALARETLVLTCRGPGFQYHNPPDYWRFVPADLSLASLLCGLWPVYCSWDPQVPGVFLKAVRRDTRPLAGPAGSMNLWALPDVLSSPRPGARR